MNFKRVLGIIIVIAGIALIFVSNYITEQVEEGKDQIAGAQKNVNRAHSLFSLSPQTKDLGQGITNSIQSKIAEGQAQIDYYENMARQLDIGGWVAIVLGAGLVFIGGRKKRA